MDRLVSTIKKFSRPLLALSFSLLGLYLRYKHFAERELWTDELFQLRSTTGPFKPVWQRLSAGGELTSFPGEYLLTYPFVQIFGAQNKWGISIPHIFSAALGFYLLYLICNRHLKTLFGFAIAFMIMTFNGNLIFHAFEFRPYAVLPTLSLAIFLLSEKVVNQGKSLNKFKKSLIGLFFILSVIYHAYGILIVGLCMLFFLLCQLDHKSLKEIIKDITPFAVPVALTSLPIFFWYASGSSVNFEGCQSMNIHTFSVYPNPLDNLWRFLKMVFANLIADKRIKQQLLVYGIWISFLLPHNQRFKQIGFLLILIILPIQLILLADVRASYWFLDRQFVWIMPLYAFFLGWCWDSTIIFLTEKFKKLRIKK